MSTYNFYKIFQYPYAVFFDTCADFCLVPRFLELLSDLEDTGAEEEDEINRREMFTTLIPFLE